MQGDHDIFNLHILQVKSILQNLYFFASIAIFLLVVHEEDGFDVLSGELYLLLLMANCIVKQVDNWLHEWV